MRGNFETSYRIIYAFNEAIKRISNLELRIVRISDARAYSGQPGALWPGDARVLIGLKAMPVRWTRAFPAWRMQLARKPRKAQTRRASLTRPSAHLKICVVFQPRDLASLAVFITTRQIDIYRHISHPALEPLAVLKYPLLVELSTTPSRS